MKIQGLNSTVVRGRFNRREELSNSAKRFKMLKVSIM